MATALTCEDRPGASSGFTLLLLPCSTVQVEVAHQVCFFTRYLFYFTRVLHCACHSYLTTVIQPPSFNTADNYPRPTTS